jgi:GTPase SAR1 family protein
MAIINKNGSWPVYDPNSAKVATQGVGVIHRLGTVRPPVAERRPIVPPTTVPSVRSRIPGDDDGYIARVVQLQALRHDIKAVCPEIDDRVDEGMQTLEGLLVEQLVAARARRGGNQVVTVAVVGDFSSGKSTFINALLGEKEFCPVAAEPSTSSVTYFRYGDTRTVEMEVETPGGTGRRTITENEYRNLVKHPASGTTSTHVFHAAIPAEILRRIKLVDTPGFSNPCNPTDSKVTESAVKQADALFVIMDIAKGNPSQELLRQLETLRGASADATSSAKPAFLLLNKADAKASKTERHEVLQDARTKYAKVFRRAALVSAQRLAASPDSEALAELSRAFALAQSAVLGRRPFSLTLSGSLSATAKGLAYLAHSGDKDFALSVQAEDDLSTRGALVDLLSEVEKERLSLLDAHAKRRLAELRGSWDSQLGALAAAVKRRSDEFKSDPSHASSEIRNEFKHVRNSVINNVSEVFEFAIENLFHESIRIKVNTFFDDTFYQVLARPQQAIAAAKVHSSWRKTAKLLARIKSIAAQKWGVAASINEALLCRQAFEWIQTLEKRVLREFGPYNTKEFENVEARANWLASCRKEFDEEKKSWISGFTDKQLAPALDGLQDACLLAAGVADGRERADRAQLLGLIEDIRKLREDEP